MNGRSFNIKTNYSQGSSRRKSNIIGFNELEKVWEIYRGWNSLLKTNIGGRTENFVCKRIYNLICIIHDATGYIFCFSTSMKGLNLECETE